MTQTSTKEALTLTELNLLLMTLAEKKKSPRTPGGGGKSLPWLLVWLLSPLSASPGNWTQSNEDCWLMRNVTHSVRASISAFFLDPPEGGGGRRLSRANQREAGGYYPHLVRHQQQHLCQRRFTFWRKKHFLLLGFGEENKRLELLSDPDSDPVSRTCNVKSSSADTTQNQTWLCAEY